MFNLKKVATLGAFALISLNSFALPAGVGTQTSSNQARQKIEQASAEAQAAQATINSELISFKEVIEDMFNLPKETTAENQATLKNKIMAFFAKDSASQQTSIAPLEWSEIEMAALAKLGALVDSSLLETSEVELLQSYLELKSTKYIKPTMILDAIENWPKDSQVGLTLELRKAVLKANQAGSSLTSDSAFQEVLGDKEQEFCMSCGC